MKILGIIFLCAVLLLVTFFIVDCSAGTSRYFECQVADHHYVGPWTEISTSFDSHGEVNVSTIHHEEEFHVICYESQGESRTFDFKTSRSTYYTVTNGQPVTVKTR